MAYRLLILALSFLLALVEVVPARDRQAARQAYRKALQYHHNLNQIPDSSRTRKQYSLAISLYRRVIDQDPTYGASDDALFAIASLYEAVFRRFAIESSRKRAIYYYEFVADQYPLTRHRRLALRRAEALKRKRPPQARGPARSRKTGGPGPKVSHTRPELATLGEIRYWSNEDYTRVVIQLDREVEFRKQVLLDPDRIYFDLQSARLKMNLGKSYDVNGVFLKRVRVAQNRPEIVRVVLDFKKIKRHSVFALYDPFRIVIDTSGSRSTVASRNGVEQQTIQTAEAVISLDKGPAKREVLTEKLARPSRKAGEELSLTRVLGLKIGKVAIDPGHGGWDTGTIGPGGLVEKELVLDISMRLKKLLEEGQETEVILTRRMDRFVPLEERTAIANKEGADLFISIHANASRSRRVSGVETFFLNLAPGPEERDVASRENAGSQRNIHELENLLRKIALGDYNKESRDLAAVVQRSLYAEIHKSRPRLRNRGVKQAPFIVLINATMPSILTEIGFVSNPAEEKYLRAGKARNQVAAALYQGIQSYFRSLGSAAGGARTAASSR
ncbi:MAG: N-acetylmuramoyl-L-alanine amidase [Acidobacteriota bacterium]